MGRERIIFPVNPIDFTWDGYVMKYPINSGSIEKELSRINDEISKIKLKIFTLVGATPRDICNENDDPLDYITNVFTQLIADYKFFINKQWLLYKINQYTEDIEYGKEHNLNDTIDEDTQQKWKPSLFIPGVYVESIYECEEEIQTNNKIINNLTNELMTYVGASPDNRIKNEDNDSPFDSLFFRAKAILDEDDGLEYYWHKNNDWQLILDSFNNGSYNSY